jgi:flagellar motor switch protein FliG
LGEILPIVNHGDFLVLINRSKFMSMLARFRKPGGVQQLVALLESCLSKKKEALLTTIMAEDAQFGTMVKNKILTPEKIFSWDPLTIC